MNGYDTTEADHNEVFHILSNKAVQEVSLRVVRAGNGQAVDSSPPVEPQ